MADILELINRLEEMVAESRRMPVGHNLLMDRRRLLDLIDQMRAGVPSEIREAQEIRAQRDAVLEEARREGEGILHRAQMEAAARLEETSIIRQAEARADEIIRRAEDQAQEILEDAHRQVQARLKAAEQAATNQMDEADRYALEMLRRLDQQLTAFTTTVRAGIESLTQRAEEMEMAREDDALS